MSTHREPEKDHLSVGERSRPDGPGHAGRRHTPAAGSAATMLRLQRHAGNHAVTQLIIRGAAPASEKAPALQRDASFVVQRAPGDPNDLAGTPYARFDESLKTALATKFPKGSHARLADALDDVSNVTIAILARIGSRIGDYDPGVWDYITAIPTGGWITDNWGAMFKVDVSGMVGHLSGSPKWCKDDPDSAKSWHNTTDCWREIAGGKPGLHIPVRADGTSDLHVDFHQPVEMGDGGMCKFWTSPWALAAHGVDVHLGGGARATGVARYGRLRDRLTKAAADGISAEDINKAETLLDSIMAKVREYAAKGKLQGSDFEGDKAMDNDTATMDALDKAENLLTPTPDFIGI